MRGAYNSQNALSENMGMISFYNSEVEGFGIQKMDKELDAKTLFQLTPIKWSSNLFRDAQNGLNLSFFRQMEIIVSLYRPVQTKFI